MALFGGKFDDGGGLKPGYRDMKWGDYPRKGMTLLDETPDDSVYTLPDDDLLFAGAKVERVTYKFFGGRFSDVVIEIPAAVADAVFKALTSEWGKPKQPNGFIEDFFWHNNAPGPAGSTAAFTRNPSTRGATLTIQSPYIQAKRALAQGKGPGR